MLTPAGHRAKRMLRDTGDQGEGQERPPRAKASRGRPGEGQECRLGPGSGEPGAGLGACRMWASWWKLIPQRLLTTCSGPQGLDPAGSPPTGLGPPLSPQAQGFSRPRWWSLPSLRVSVTGRALSFLCPSPQRGPSPRPAVSDCFLNE